MPKEKRSKRYANTAKGKTLVLGLGNPILGDDGVGWRITQVAEISCQEGAGDDSVVFELSSSGGLGLMELMVGYERVIIADAILTPDGEYGRIHCAPLDAIKATAHSNSSHDATLPAALETGRLMGLQLPATILVVGVEIEPTFEFSEALSPTVAAAVEPAAATLLEVLGEARSQ